MGFTPCLLRTPRAGGGELIRLGHPLLDSFLDLVTARARWNTVLATAFDLKVFFSVIDKDPVKAALIVNELVHSYMQLYTSHDSKVSQKTIEYLDDLSKEQYEEVKRLRGVVDELTKEVTGE